MTEPDGRASGYLMDLINFLRSTFQVFTHLPVSIQNASNYRITGILCMECNTLTFMMGLKKALSRLAWTVVCSAKVSTEMIYVNEMKYRFSANADLLSTCMLFYLVPSI